MAALEIGAGLSSLKTALDIVKALWTIKDATERNSKTLDLQRAISEAQIASINAQQAHSAQIERIRELEEKLRGFETWDAEKKRYELKDLGWGAFAYMLKREERGSAPPHWSCTNCYSNRRISVVQHVRILDHGYEHLCPACRAIINPSIERCDGDGAKWLD